MRQSIISQFWVGKFYSEVLFHEFVVESGDYWSDENEMSERIPLNGFIASQGEKWFDHDFLKQAIATKSSIFMRNVNMNFGRCNENIYGFS